MYLLLIQAFIFSGELLLTTEAFVHRLSRYTVYSSETTMQSMKGKGEQKVIGTELFPEAGSSYVPYGLSPEEYARIKKTEAESRKQKNYGQWGPSFAKSERPDGDWMVLPSLWTNGFTSSGATSEKMKYGDPKEDKHNNISTSKSMLPVQLLSFVMIDLLSTAAYLTNKKIVPSVLVLVISMFKLPIKPQISIKAFALLNVVKIASAFLLSFPLQELNKRCTRQFNWFNRRTIGVGLMSTLIMISTIYVKKLQGIALL